MKTTNIINILSNEIVTQRLTDSEPIPRIKECICLDGKFWRVIDVIYNMKNRNHRYSIDILVAEGQ